MNTQPLHWMIDPGHAWLAVDLDTYPTARDYGTGYGYKHGRWIYLEEDIEAPAFLLDHPDAAAEHASGALTVRRFDFDAPCRNYNNNEDRLDIEGYLERDREARTEATA